MKRTFFLNIILLNAFAYINGAVVTYDFSGGRFGDNLLAYLHAKWISHEYNIPLLYKPFKYSDCLQMDCSETKTPVLTNMKSKILTKRDMTIDPEQNVLYVIPYFSEVLYERRMTLNSDWIFFKVDWNDPEFLAEIRKMIKPRDPALMYNKPCNDKICVAMHVRKGGNFDKGDLLSDVADNLSNNNYSGYKDYGNALKFPPEHFYITQIKRVSELLNNVPLYVFIFTDDLDPAAIVNRFKMSLHEYSNIHFDYRTEGNSDSTNVLEDFFGMIQFDCLIRAQSNYSLIAGKLGNFAIEIAPVTQHWEGAISVIDTVEENIKKDHRVWNKIFHEK